MEEKRLLEKKVSGGLHHFCEWVLSSLEEKGSSNNISLYITYQNIDIEL